MSADITLQIIRPDPTAGPAWTDGDQSPSCNGKAHGSGLHRSPDTAPCSLESRDSSCPYSGGTRHPATPPDPAASPHPAK